MQCLDKLDKLDMPIFVARDISIFGAENIIHMESEKTVMGCTIIFFAWLVHQLVICLIQGGPRFWIIIHSYSTEMRSFHVI